MPRRGTLCGAARLAASHPAHADTARGAASRSVLRVKGGARRRGSVARRRQRRRASAAASPTPTKSHGRTSTQPPLRLDDGSSGGVDGRRRRVEAALRALSAARTTARRPRPGRRRPNAAPFAQRAGAASSRRRARPRAHAHRRRRCRRPTSSGRAGGDAPRPRGSARTGTPRRLIGLARGAPCMQPRGRWSSGKGGRPKLAYSASGLAIRVKALPNSIPSAAEVLRKTPRLAQQRGPALPGSEPRAQRRQTPEHAREREAAGVSRAPSREMFAARALSPTHLGDPRCACAAASAVRERLCAPRASRCSPRRRACAPGRSPAREPRARAGRRQPRRRPPASSPPKRRRLLLERPPQWGLDRVAHETAGRSSASGQRAWCSGRASTPTVRCARSKRPASSARARRAYANAEPDGQANATRPRARRLSRRTSHATAPTAPRRRRGRRDRGLKHERAGDGARALGRGGRGSSWAAVPSSSRGGPKIVGIGAVAIGGRRRGARGGAAGACRGELVVVPRAPSPAPAAGDRQRRAGTARNRGRRRQRDGRVARGSQRPAPTARAAPSGGRCRGLRALAAPAAAPPASVSASAAGASAAPLPAKRQLDRPWPRPRASSRARARARARRAGAASVHQEAQHALRAANCTPAISKARGIR